MRFACRLTPLNFRLDEDLLSAARDVSIAERLRQKVSRERIGKELWKTLLGPAPFHCFRLLDKCALHTAVLALPEHLSHANQHVWHHCALPRLYAAEIAYKEIISDTLDDSIRPLSLGSEIMPLLCLAVACTPLRGLEFKR